MKVRTWKSAYYVSFSETESWHCIKSNDFFYFSDSVTFPLYLGKLIVWYGVGDQIISQKN